MYFQGKIETSMSSLPFNLETNGFKCLPKHGIGQTDQYSTIIVPRFNLGKIQIWPLFKRGINVRKYKANGRYLKINKFSKGL